MPLGRIPTIGDLFALETGIDGPSDDLRVWNKLSKDLFHIGLPADDVAFVRLLTRRVHDITGCDLETGQRADRCTLSLTWWHQVALPTLVARFLAMGGEKRTPDARRG